MQGHITGLWRYPVKGCAGERVQMLQLRTDASVAGDREWAVVDADNTLTWQGAVPTLACVKAVCRAEGLLLTGPDGLDLHLANPTAQPGQVRAWNEARADFDRLSATDGGDEAAALLQRATGHPGLRLVRLAPTAWRRSGVNALHLVTQASLDAWQAEVSGDLTDLPERARLNVLLTLDGNDANTPFLEDHARALQTPGLALRITQRCVRCVVPTVNPRTGDLAPQALSAITALSQARWPGQAVCFGVYAEAIGPGELRLGDRVELELDF